MIRPLILSTFLLILTGCGRFTQVNTQNPQTFSRGLFSSIEQLERKSTFDEQNSNVILAQAATSVSQSLQELAKIQRSVHNISHVREDPSLQNIKVHGRTSIDWTGPVDKLLAKIATHARLKFVVLGQKPALPIIVSVNKKDVSIADLIRDVSYMVQNQALVSFKHPTIELRYF